MKTKPRVIFMGTPDFSVFALNNLAQDDRIDIPLVVTQPDRPKGRGKKLAVSPVKKAALQLGLDLFQPEKANSPDSLQEITALEPDFFVVAAFGQILSKKLLDVPRYYPINIHASLLPLYRGASPIQAAILNMDETTGVTTMVMAPKMDAGDILLQASTPILPEDTAQDLHDRLGALGGRLIIKTIFGILDDSVTPVPQDHTKATYVKMLKKNDGRINWTLSARKIAAHINAMTPWPGAFTYLFEKRMKIFTVSVSDAPSDEKPGVIINCDKNGIHVATGNGILTILELMGSSGKRLKSSDYLLGHQIEPGSSFS